MLKDKITAEEIKKIFSNKVYKLNYIEQLCKIKKQAVPKLRTNDKIDEFIMYNWDYDISKILIRKIFKSTKKYKNCKNSVKSIVKLRKRWDILKLGAFDWPFQARGFDQFVQRINNSDLKDKNKDKILADEVIRFRRIKEINTKRNDYIEYLLFINNEDIIPTLEHKSGVDFYINGLPYDQKVSRSVGNKFIEKYGVNYREKAIENPALVAECLYNYQDGERFGSEPRVLIVYLDTDLAVKDLEDSLKKASFNKPYEIEFEYPQPDKTFKTYKTTCYVILLYSEEKTN